MGRSAGIVGFLFLVAVLIVGGFLAVDRLAGDDAAETVIDKPILGTATIIQTDLIERETFPAVLRFARPQVVNASLTGTVTQLPAEGSQLARGDTMVEIDGEPVVLFIGGRPMWRTLALPLDGSDLEGPDVRQLEQNLSDLGYPTLRDDEDELPDISAPDDTFDDETVRLIEDWRADLGLSEGGFVEVGRIIYLETPVRVARTLTTTGTFLGPGIPILEVSSADQEVFLQLAVDKRELIEVGTGVLVTLPDDVEAAATIVEIGSVVTYFDEDSPGVIAVGVFASTIPRWVLALMSLRWTSRSSPTRSWTRWRCPSTRCWRWPKEDMPSKSTGKA